MIRQLAILINKNIRGIPWVPLSFLLSGGIDSSLVLALLRKIRPHVLISTFSMAESKDYPDMVFARRIANLFKTDHHEIILSEKQYKQFRDEYDKVKLYDSRGDLNVYILCSFARAFSNIIITGDGGDECFGGYWLHKYPLGHKENGEIKCFEEIHSRPKAHLQEMFDMKFRDFLFKENSNEGDYDAVWEYYIKTILTKQINPLRYVEKLLKTEIHTPLFSNDIVNFMRELPYTERIDKKIERELALGYLPKSVIARRKLALSTL